MNSIEPHPGLVPGEEPNQAFSLSPRLVGGLLLLAFLLSGCSSNPANQITPSSLDPHGYAAARIASLWWLMFGLGTLVYVVVMGALLYALFRKRRDRETEEQPDRERRPVVWGGMIIPTIILLVVFGFTIDTLRAVSNPGRDETLTIEVVGRQWWWEVHYPNQQISTANEIHIPVGQPVQLKLTSQDVIHSFWVPQLHGKMDMNPERVNNFWIQADQPGEYWGECAEFCGIQHAKMRFLVVAEPPDQFTAWVENQQQPAPQPTDPLALQGEQIFLSSSCITCHAIEGTNATGELGPDLTHLASRRTLGAGAVENNRGHLSGWLSDPQSIKPGNYMPPSALTGEELNALLAYLETLK